MPEYAVILAVWGFTGSGVFGDSAYFPVVIADIRFMAFIRAPRSSCGVAVVEDDSVSVSSCLA